LTKRKYINKGKCIWCLKSEPDVTFYNAPHTISKKLGAINIGTDICDSCNYYFGTVDKNLSFPMSVETAYKEIIGVMKLMLSKLDEDTYKTFKSIYFNFFYSKKTLQFKHSFKSNPYFIASLTRQFKKGVYEVFLQEYHRETGNGLDRRFGKIRNFVRFDKGNLPLYFLSNNGVYLLEEDINSPSFTFNKNVISEIDDFGFYTMIVLGNFFFLEVTPRAELSREIYLKKQSSKLIGSGFIFRKLVEMKRITDLDFTLRALR
jgi:hypothetical protein